MVQSPASPPQASVLGACLVEGDSEFEKRARRIKRRAMVASVVLQLLFVAALILLPLLSKGEGIATYSYTPLPPYRRGTVTEHRQPEQRPATGKHTVCNDCFNHVPPIIATVERTPPADGPDPSDIDIPGTSEGQNLPGALALTSDRRPDPPPNNDRVTTRTIKVSAGVQSARLVHRVEPVYPPLPRSIHREGRVELRALIASDGGIKSLEVVSGDPMFITSALRAVQEWRYQPTLLNNEPVEVETFITVVYTLSH